MRRFVLGLLMAVAAGGLIWWVTRRPQPPAANGSLKLAPATEPAFARALAPRAFHFPEDHGPHSEFQTEWWYYTGNLETEQGRHFGYQLTFFRRGLDPRPGSRGADLAATEIYFAHFAVTDVQGKSHPFTERFSRGAGGLAGASGSPFHVWLEDWSVESVESDGSSVRLVASDGAWRLNLTLRATKPIVAHGDAGLSAKSDQPGNASYYLSYTRLETEGTLTQDGSDIPVAGQSWFDHEWSTSALGAQAVGWDWYSLQLSDGRDLMLFRIRNADGTIDSVSGGTLVEQDGTVRHVRSSDVSIDVLEHWRSPESGGTYPSRWRLQLPSEGIELTLAPWLSDQELRVSFPYWEGAVRITGTIAGREVTGNGYVELTGYVRSMQGVF